MIESVMFHTAREIRRRLGISWEMNLADLSWSELPGNMRVNHGEPIFPRIDLTTHRKVTEMNEDKGKFQEQEENLIDIESFSKVELRVALVEGAERVEKSKKLIKLQLDLGEIGKRQVVAGIAHHYSPEELVGLKVIVVANLKPAKLMGIESHGMILAAKAGDTLTLLTVHKDMTPGAKIS
ncbi:MAG TPA: methionine--tRNA ligase subunit beta, partial [Mesotoga sp.]|nr:methionine--tRNA ligase subunit beta [Mesotoga sp.]